jgi:hypothetical protein
MLMTTRIVRKAVNDLEPQLAIKPWRLKAVGCEHNLKTPPAPCLHLRQFEETTPDSLPAMPLVYPDLPNLAAAAPCVPAEAGDDLILRIATENSKTQRIDDPSRLGVELVQTVLEKVDLCWRRIRSHDQFWSCHGVLRCPDTSRLADRASPAARSRPTLAAGCM